MGKSWSSRIDYISQLQTQKAVDADMKFEKEKAKNYSWWLPVRESRPILAREM